jgi:hypothetical protein
MMFYKIKLLLIAICLLPYLVHASDQQYVELQSRYTKMYIDYVVNDDFTVERISELEIKVLNEKAVKKFKKKRFSHSTSIEKFEVLEAYTIKADGSRINVPKGNYQITVNKGNADSRAIFSDRTSVTIVFPDLEVQDSIYMKVKNFQTEPMFPKNFSASTFFWSQMAYDNVKIYFDLPQHLIFKHQVRGMAEKTKINNGRKLIELTYKSEKPVKIKRDNFSVWDESKEAGYALSTFMDYESIAKAYGARALPKSVPSDRVKKLAKKIVAKETDKKQQARLLYDWVATNISYAGNCIGIGAVVPHDTDFILDNRMGDCKDHATLLQAFYNTVGIESTQALINSGSSYSLPEIPMVTSVNHVINYIPEWDKFVDATNPSMPFDRLAFRLSDKPVILVEQFKPGKKTPATQIGDNHQVVDSTMKIQPDGSVIGDIHVKTKGRPAIGLRAIWRHATQEQEDKWIEKTFSSQNNIGSASMKKDDPVSLLPEFTFSVEFDKPEFILPKGTGGFYVAPLINTGMSVNYYLNYSKEEIKGFSVACANGYSIESLVYEFPESMKVLAKPDNFEITENHIYYKATYELEGNKLKVVRELNDKTPGNVCSAETMNQRRITLIKIAENMQAQIIYQH